MASRVADMLSGQHRLGYLGRAVSGALDVDRADYLLRDSYMTGVRYGFAPGSETMLYAKSLLPANAEWAAFGASRWAFPMLAQAFLLGGHCRIGMEDAVYLENGVKTRGNKELVEKGVRIIRELGGRVASVEEARGLLGLPSKADVRSAASG